jgi:3-isopropylmalate/(R)-2-methylmalate dehydratase small subunit
MTDEVALKRLGRVAWIFSDNFDADMIVGYENITETDVDKLAKICMANFDPKFHDYVKAGDIIVAGKNFGYGHPHSQPLVALQKIGINCIVAETFFPPFFRNGIALGFLLIECNGITKEVSRWDVLEIDATSAEVKNLTSGKVLKAKPLPKVVLEIISKEGLVSYLRERLRRKNYIIP